MDIVLLIVLVLLTGIASTILYLNLKSKPKDENENKEAEEMANLKLEITNLKDTLNTTINNSLGSMSTSFNALSTGVTKDMTETLRANNLRILKDGEILKSEACMMISKSSSKNKNLQSLVKLLSKN